MADTRGYLLHDSMKGKWHMLLCKVRNSAEGCVIARVRGVVETQPYAPLRVTNCHCARYRFAMTTLIRAERATTHRYGFTEANF